MVIKTLTCNFSQSKIYPGHGKLFIRIDSKVGGPPPPIYL
jgi:ribosomal protein L24E